MNTQNLMKEREKERKKITFAANCIENFHTKILKTEKLFFLGGGGVILVN